jgi:glycosyltransferase involved in cell wall biosynthesis
VGCDRLGRVRIVIDYRPALRARTGVGEYIHQVVRSLSEVGGDAITAFSSSWKDRPPPDLARELHGVRVVDRRFPVRALNLAWHRLQWPPVETLTGDEYDVAHSPHPLLLPSRSAAQVVTIHDVHFLAHPERTSREVRRDYPVLARRHAHRADGIIVPSRFTASEVQRAFDIPAAKIAVCLEGAPHWKTAPAPADDSGYVLFLGTLDGRKNIGGLLRAYGGLLAQSTTRPKLIIAGGSGPEAATWLRQIDEPPLAGHVEYRGYIPDDQREALFKGAQLFVLPSFEEGFGLPALEAMAAGVPVVASNRGSLPEVVGDAGLLVDPDEPAALAHAIDRVITDPGLRSTLSRRGLDRANEFTWAHTARAVRSAYEDAISAFRERRHV